MIANLRESGLYMFAAAGVITLVRVVFLGESIG